MLVLSAVAAVRANSYAQRLKLRLAVIHGNTKQDLIEDGRTSPPPEGSAGFIHPSRSRTSASQSGTLRPHPLLAAQCRYVCVCVCARLYVCASVCVHVYRCLSIHGHEPCWGRQRPHCHYCGEWLDAPSGCEHVPWFICTHACPHRTI